ncbi:MAG: L-aspartate oxidase [Candidatus Lernaella stagnicola]|nr:L-aspartate oxidase [Candidatus Lernaella stagnicola]
MPHVSDVLVLGSGVAGLITALQLADSMDVTLVTKSSIDESNTKYAQGGVAAVTSLEDSLELHVADTLDAGAGLCNEDVVRMVVSEGPARIRELIDLGVTFDRRNEDPAKFDLHREGGHSKRRILHVGDLTGAEIERVLVQRVQDHDRIHVFENHFAIDLITTSKFYHNRVADQCLGAYVLDKQSGEVLTILATYTVMATGGAGKVYLITSNPDVATGDGLAIAWRAGAAIGAMEFYQFHPTCLYHPYASNFLISEAVRGEGGMLINARGGRFMDKVDPRGCLAPRDIVARAIDAEIKRTGTNCVYLDISHLGDQAAEKFPHIYSKCLTLSIDITKEPIPVAPAAHYMCGGVVTNRLGESTLPNLFVIGEASYTGLHGANRLASNSLLEALVFGHNAAEEIVRRGKQTEERIPVPDWDASGTTDPNEAIMVTHNWEEVRRTMTNYVGIVRSDSRLKRAKRRIKMIINEIDEYYWDFTVTPDLLELRNLALVAQLIIRAARKRRESRGLHYSLDYPDTLSEPQEFTDRRRLSWFD